MAPLMHYLLLLRSTQPHPAYVLPVQHYEVLRGLSRFPGTRLIWLGWAGRTAAVQYYLLASTVPDAFLCDGTLAKLFLHL